MSQPVKRKTARANPVLWQANESEGWALFNHRDEISTLRGNNFKSRWHVTIDIVKLDLPIGPGGVIKHQPAPRSSFRKRYRFHALASDPDSIAAQRLIKDRGDDEHYFVMAQNVREAYKDAQRGV